MSFPSWAIGVVLIVIGSLGNNLGNNLVSMGHTETKKESQKLTNSKNPQQRAEINLTPEDKAVYDYRTIGTVIFILGNLLTFASFGFGAQSLLASLESIQFVSNLVFAKYCHNEKITIRMMVATVSIVVGNVLVVIFAQHNAVLYNSIGMITLYKTNNAYHGYLVMGFCLWAASSFVYAKYFDSRVKHGVLLWKHSFIEPFCFAFSSSIIGTQALLNSKCMSMLIQSTLRTNKNEFESWYIYFIAITWVALVAYWLHRLDRGLALFPPLFIIPVMQVFFVFFAILCGGIYFEEFNQFQSKQWAGFIIGVSMILGGVYGLAPTDMVLSVPDNVVAPDEQRYSAAASDMDDKLELAIKDKPSSVNLYSAVDTNAQTNSQRKSINNPESFDNIPEPDKSHVKESLHISMNYYAEVGDDQLNSTQPNVSIRVESEPTLQNSPQDSSISSNNHGVVGTVADDVV